MGFEVLGVGMGVGWVGWGNAEESATGGWCGESWCWEGRMEGEAASGEKVEMGEGKAEIGLGGQKVDCKSWFFKSGGGSNPFGANKVSEGRSADGTVTEEIAWGRVFRGRLEEVKGCRKVTGQGALGDGKAEFGLGEGAGLVET